MLAYWMQQWDALISTAAVQPQQKQPPQHAYIRLFHIDTGRSMDVAAFAANLPDITAHDEKGSYYWVWVGLHAIPWADLSKSTRARCGPLLYDDRDTVARRHALLRTWKRNMAALAAQIPQRAHGHRLADAVAPLHEHAPALWVCVPWDTTVARRTIRDLYARGLVSREHNHGVDAPFLEYLRVLVTTPWRLERGACALPTLLGDVDANWMPRYVPPSSSSDGVEQHIAAYLQTGVWRTCKRLELDLEPAAQRSAFRAFDFVVPTRSFRNDRVLRDVAAGAPPSHVPAHVSATTTLHVNGLLEDVFLALYDISVPRAPCATHFVCALPSTSTHIAVFGFYVPRLGQLFLCLGPPR